MKHIYLLLALSFFSLEAKTTSIKEKPKQKTSKIIEKKDVLTVTEKNFESVILKAKNPVILDVYAEWCGPCRRMAPIFEEVANKFKTKKISFAKIKMENFEDSDKHIQLLKKKLDISISMIPTMLYIKDGKVIETIVGSQSAESLNAKLTNLMKPTKTVISKKSKC